MPGPLGDLEEWQTLEVNVTQGEGDFDLLGLPFLKVTRGPRHYLFCYSRQFYFFMHILIFTSFSSCEMTDSDTLGLHVNFYDELQK